MSKIKQTPNKHSNVYCEIWSNYAKYEKKERLVWLHTSRMTGVLYNVLHTYICYVCVYDRMISLRFM